MLSPRPLLLLWLTITSTVAHAQLPMMPPAFIGGVPGLAQMQALDIQRHQARTLLYREALEELRKNPAAADVPVCPPGAVPAGTLCLAREDEPVPPAETKPAAAAKAAEVAAPVAEPAAVVAEPAAVVAAKAPMPRRRLAVLIGNNGYRSPIPELETPIADVQRIGEVLQSQYGFETRILKDAGKADIVEALNRVAREATPDDSVLLFYAGHGYLMDDTHMGFWIPVDASVKTATGWISNTDISKLLAAIKARQLILVSDSCFSGSLTKEQKVSYGGTPKPEEVLQRRSVLVLSSGGEEPVSDEGKEGHSIFAWNLIHTLRSANGITPGYEVYRTVHGNVVKDYPQEPQYGAVISAGHASGGEYLFDASRP